jgi:hypothetical protein
MSFGSNGTFTINPGLWSSLSITGQANVIMTTGVYAFTGGFDFSGQGSVTAHGVTIFLTCQGYGTGSNCPNTGGTGGYVNLGGQGSADVTAPGSAQFVALNVALYSDPHLLDPVSTSGCVNGSQQCLLSSGGQGNGISGTVDVRWGGVSMQGNGTASVDGRLIANSVNMQVSGHVGSGLNVSGGGSSVSTSPCGVLDADVTGVTKGTTGNTGRAIVQSQCGLGSDLSGVVNFDYKP